MVASPLRLLSEVVMTKKALPFEKSKKDKEARGMKEGSKRETALDKKQMKVKAYRKGGKCG